MLEIIPSESLAPLPQQNAAAGVTVILSVCVGCRTIGAMGAHLAASILDLADTLARRRNRCDTPCQQAVLHEAMRVPPAPLPSAPKSNFFCVQNVAAPPHPLAALPHLH